MNNQHVVIIGGGLSGLSCLVQLIDQLTDRIPYPSSRPRIKITLVERQNRIGLGVAYNTPLNAHIMNSRIKIGSLYFKQKDHLTNWLMQHQNELLKQYPDLSTNSHDYLPRRLYSEYLQDAALIASKKAKASMIDVVIKKACAISFKKKTGTYLIGLDNEESLIATDVVIATGEESPHNYRELTQEMNFINSPWPIESWMQKINHNARVGILGSGLSAIDTWIALNELKHSGKVFFISRNGLLPRVQPASDNKPSLCYLTLANLKKIRKKRALTLNDIKHMMHQELTTVTSTPLTREMILGGEKDVRTQLQHDLLKGQNNETPILEIILTSFPLGASIWSMLEDAEKTYFLKNESTHFYRLFSMPISNAEKILAALDSGQLTILPNLNTITPKGSCFEVAFFSGPPLEVDFIINATGQGSDITQSSNPLLQNLLQQGIISPHSCGGIRANLKTFECLDSDNLPQANIYALGPILRGELLFTNGGPLNVACAYLLAQKIAEKLYHYSTAAKIFDFDFSKLNEDVPSL